MLSDTPHIEAEITFLNTAEGGRRTPALSGYRPQFYYGEQDWDAIHTYPDVELVYPGQTARVLLTFLSPERQVGRLHPGMRFQCREGQRVIANGVILKILGLEKPPEK